MDASTYVFLRNWRASVWPPSLADGLVGRHVHENRAFTSGETFLKVPSASTRVKDTPSTPVNPSTCTSATSNLTMLYRTSCVLLLHVLASASVSSTAAAAFVPVGHPPATAYRRPTTTTARQADAYSYTYGSSAPPPQGTGGNGPKADDGRVVRIQRAF
jgi:hypothetical protein